MQLQLNFRHMNGSEELDSLIREKAAGLEKLTDDIGSCRVIVEPAGKHHVHGNLIAVRIELAVPGDELAVTRKTGENGDHKDARLALRDAFDAARRQLEEYMQRRRRQVKNHEPRERSTGQTDSESSNRVAEPAQQSVEINQHKIANSFESENCVLHVMHEEAQVARSAIANETTP